MSYTIVDKVAEILDEEEKCVHAAQLKRYRQLGAQVLDIVEEMEKLIISS